MCALVVVLALLWPAMPALLSPAAAHPVPPSSFDPPSTSWSSVRGMSSSRFGDHFDTMVDRGFMVVDLEVDVHDGGYRVGAVFQDNPDGRGWVSRRDLTHSQYSDLWQRMRARGYRVHDQETYVVDGRRRWAGVFIENVEDLAWASQRNLTADQFAEQFAERRRSMIPVDYERYQTGAGERFSIAWVDNVDGTSWELRHGLSSSAFSAAFDRLEDTHRVVDIESDGGRYHAIWHANDNGRGWLSLRGMDDRAYANRWNRYRDLGYRVVDFEEYQTRAGRRYAAVWRQDGDRPDWEHRQRVDALVTAQLEDFDVPGIAVAVVEDGEVRYQRGFGDADVDAGVWMDSRHVNRLASVSKAVAGTLTMQLVEDGLVELDDPARDHLSLPAGHDYTVGDLASNRSCIRHYDRRFDGFTSDHYDTAAAAFAEIVDDPLLAGCDFGEVNYSTHASTGTAALAEVLDGASIEEVVETRITAEGMPTLQPEDLSESPRRAAIYTRSGDDNVEVDRDDLSWKVLGGGLESSIQDLGRYGSKLLQGELVDPALVTTQLTPPDASSRYAYGWNTAGSGSSFRAGKNGGQPGANSYLRLMPEQDVVIAVLTNRRSGGHDAGRLARQIGQVVVGF